MRVPVPLEATMRNPMSGMLGALVLLLLALPGLAIAQTGQAVTTGESFTLDPGTVATGATDVWVQIEGMESDFFARPSGRACGRGTSSWSWPAGRSTTRGNCSRL